LHKRRLLWLGLRRQVRKPNASCSSDINRDFDGNWDLTEKLASFVDTGGPIVCHNTDQATLYSGAQSFTTRGEQIAASKVCQAAVDECDLAEYCPGGADEGPKDDYLYPGKTCTREGYSGWVYGGRCESQTHHAQVTSTVTSMETGT
jgi:hypothetical protein